MAVGDRFIQCKFRAMVLGETNSSELWFRNPNGLVFTAPELVDALHAELKSALFAEWLDVHSVHYVLTDLQFQVYDENWVPLLVPPITHAGGGAGSLAGNIAGRSQCMLVRFSLDRSSGEIPPAMQFPQGGRLFRGPVPVAFVTNTNDLNVALFPAGTLETFLAWVSQSFGGGPIGNFTPIRVSAPAPAMTNDDPPVPHPSAGKRSWARIAGASVAPFVAGQDGRDR